MQEVVDTYYEANGYDQQMAPLVTIGEGLGVEGFHDENNIDEVNEIYLDADTIDNYVASGDVAGLVSLGVHETTHVNRMSELTAEEEAIVKNNDLSDLDAVYEIAQKKAERACSIHC